MSAPDTLSRSTTRERLRNFGNPPRQLSAPQEFSRPPPTAAHRLLMLGAKTKPLVTGVRAAAN